MGHFNISGNTLFTWEHWCVCCLYDADWKQRQTATSALTNQKTAHYLKDYVLLLQKQNRI